MQPQQLIHSRAGTDQWWQYNSRVIFSLLASLTSIELGHHLVASASIKIYLSIDNNSNDRNSEILI
jgi:hypothetical protein